jgi:glycerol-3-phosphate acyltransferase PlsY
MTFVGGAFVLAPPAAAICLVLCVAVSLLAGFAWGARAGVFAFPLVQLVTDPVEHVAATGALMTLIGALFLLQPRLASQPQH